MAVTATTAQSLSLDVSTKQLSDQNTSGTLLGASITDLIGFYNVSPAVAQRTTGNNTSLTTGSTTTVIWAVTKEIQTTLINLGLMPST